MNAELSIQSSALGQSGSGSTLTPLLNVIKSNDRPDSGRQQMTHHNTNKRDQKRIMILMALCLTFATAVPVMLLAAG